MRKAIFTFISVLLVAAVAFVPSGSVSAYDPPTKDEIMAMSESELIESIDKELKEARNLTDDRQIKSLIQDIRRKVAALSKHYRAGEEECALALKFEILAMLLELANSLPQTAEFSTSQSTTATPTAAPASTLANELNRIYFKVKRLIELEEGETAILRPRLPTCQPPTGARMTTYSVKFLCGPAMKGEPGVRPAAYATAINIHNPNSQEVCACMKAVIANPPGGKSVISPIECGRIGPDGAVEIDCDWIRGLLGVEEITRFVKGFGVVYTPGSLDVVGVYTADSETGFSLDVEYICPPCGVSTGITPGPTPPPEPECPQGCRCIEGAMTYAQQLPYEVLCQGQRIPCGRNGICVKQPEPCPEDLGCQCLPGKDAMYYVEQGWDWCQGRAYWLCGWDDSGPQYCVQPPPTTPCTDECECIPESRVYDLLNEDWKWCQGRQEWLCAYKDGQRYFCMEAPVTCPPGQECEDCVYPCYCAEEWEIQEFGLTPCLDEYQRNIICGYGSDGAAWYCAQEGGVTTTPVPQTEPCPEPCKCVTQQEGEPLLKLGWGWCYGKQPWVCGYDQSGVEMYCLGPPEEEPTPTETQCPPECECLTAAEGKQQNLTYCQGTQMECAWDQNQRPIKYCFQEIEEPPTAYQYCPQGCECMTPKQAEIEGYNEWCLDKYGDEIKCGDNQYCFRKPTTLRMLK